MNPLLHGTRGHPLHPPFTDAAIGMYTLAAALGVIGALGWIEEAAGKGMWLALVGGLIASLGASTTGFVDWLTIERGTPLFRTATAHMLAMAAASVFFLLAAIFQYSGYDEGNVTAAGLVLTLLGFGLLTVGGWLGGAIVFTHGMRVESLPDLPAREAASPTGAEDR
jgi:uncharacterized membrane protein